MRWASTCARRALVILGALILALPATAETQHRAGKGWQNGDGVYLGPWQRQLSPDELKRAILYAAEMGALPQIKELLTLGGTAKDNDYLHAAVRHGAVDVAEFFLEQGGDANFLPRDGRSCWLVGIAASRGDREMMRVLVAHGADVNLNENKNKVDSPLLCSVYRGETKAVKLLVDFGAKVNAQNQNRDTPLFQALIHTDANGEEIVKLLLELGADPDLASSDNVTPRQLARLRMPPAVEWMEQAKPRVRKIYPAERPLVRFSLDALDQKTFNQIVGFELFGRFIPNPSQPRPDQQAEEAVIYYFDELIAMPVPNCPSARRYLAGTRHGHEGSVIVALCGAGPFDEFQVSDTLRFVRGLMRVEAIVQKFEGAGDADQAKQFADWFAEEPAGPDLRLVSTLMQFVAPDRGPSPTCAAVDRAKHYSLVAQLRGDSFEGLTGAKLRSLCRRLHQHLSALE